MALAVPNSGLYRLHGIQEHGHHVDTDFAQLAATLLHADAGVLPIALNASEERALENSAATLNQYIGLLDD